MEKQIKNYRTGPAGALLDIYERAIEELILTLDKVADHDYSRISNPNSPDPDCMSVKTIMEHVIAAGYGYAVYIRQALNDEGIRPKIADLSKSEALQKIGEMFAYTLATF